MITKGVKPDFFEWWAESEAQPSHIYRERRFPGGDFTGCLVGFEPRIRSLSKVFRCHDCVDWVCTLHFPDECDGCEWCDHVRGCSRLRLIPGVDWMSGIPSVVVIQ